MSQQKFDRNRKILAAFAVAVLIIVIAALSFSDRTSKPMAINGDMLGQDSAESLSGYVARAGESLVAAPADENAFALVTFTEPQTPADAGGVLTDVTRVNALVLLSAAPMPLPEPVDGETRADVFNRQLEMVQRSLDGIGDVQAPTRINGVIVWDDGDTLRELAADAAVLAVQALPADAGWGHFGVRPVFTDDRATDRGGAGTALEESA